MSTQWDPIDIEMGRETSRRIIAILVVITFALSIAAGFVTLWWIDEGEMAERADVALRIGAPVVAIVGTILGFYFGRETEE
jgi:hypothetical protein